MKIRYSKKRTPIVIEGVWDYIGFISFLAVASLFSYNSVMFIIENPKVLFMGTVALATVRGTFWFMKKVLHI